MIRSFVGLPLPPHATQALERLQGGLPMARAVPPENMHLTLAFLDDQPEVVLRTLSEELGALKIAPFDVCLSGVNVLGGKQPGAIAVDANGGDALISLQARVTRVVRETGIELERRKFRPHVTILRLPKRVETIERARIQDWIRYAAEFDPVSFSADSMGLFRSVLKKSGAEHDLLAEYPFIKGGI